LPRLNGTYRFARHSASSWKTYQETSVRSPDSLPTGAITMSVFPPQWTGRQKLLPRTLATFGYEMSRAWPDSCTPKIRTTKCQPTRFTRLRGLLEGCAVPPGRTGIPNTRAECRPACWSRIFSFWTSAPSRCYAAERKGVRPSAPPFWRTSTLVRFPVAYTG
jgi:hypothetical protein